MASEADGVRGCESEADKHKRHRGPGHGRYLRGRALANGSAGRGAVLPGDT